MRVDAGSCRPGALSMEADGVVTDSVLGFCRTWACNAARSAEFGAGEARPGNKRTAQRSIGSKTDASGRPGGKSRGHRAIVQTPLRMLRLHGSRRCPGRTVEETGIYRRMRGALRVRHRQHYLFREQSRSAPLQHRPPIVRTPAQKYRCRSSSGDSGAAMPWSTQMTAGLGRHQAAASEQGTGALGRGGDCMPAGCGRCTRTPAVSPEALARAANSRTECEPIRAVRTGNGYKFCAERLTFANILIFCKFVAAADGCRACSGETRSNNRCPCQRTSASTTST